MSIESIAVPNVMVRDVATASETHTARDIAKIMKEKNIGSVVIVKKAAEGKPVGIITERDIVRLAGSDGSMPLELLARDVMSKPVITINAMGSVRDALLTMEQKGIRRLPVLDKEGQMLGLVSDKDIFRALVKSQSLVASFCESLAVDHRQVYERLGEFIFSEMAPGASRR